MFTVREPGGPAFVSRLGVTQKLSAGAVFATVPALATAPGSTRVAGYLLPEPLRVGENWQWLIALRRATTACEERVLPTLEPAGVRAQLTT